METIVFVVAIVVAALGFGAMKYLGPKIDARNRRKLIEAEMRQDIVDASTRQTVAARILRERGEQR